MTAAEEESRAYNRLVKKQLKKAQRAALKAAKDAQTTKMAEEPDYGIDKHRPPASEEDEEQRRFLEERERRLSCQKMRSFSPFSSSPSAPPHEAPWLHRDLIPQNTRYASMDPESQPRIALSPSLGFCDLDFIDDCEDEPTAPLSLAPPPGLGGCLPKGLFCE